MKESLVKKLREVAKNHKIIKYPILLLVAVMVAVYHIFAPLINRRRKILFVVSAILMFTAVSSFSVTQRVLSEEFDEDINNKVVIESEEGDIEAEILDDSSVLAGEEELIALLKESEKNLDNSAVVDRSISVPDVKNDDMIVYNDEKGAYETVGFEDDWMLILVNKTHLIPQDYDFELGTIKGNIKSDIRIVPNVLDMIKAAREDGVVLAICSPYRDYDRQVMLFDRKKAFYLRKGFSQEEAFEKASETVAIPGTSEHQIGLAFDFISDDYSSLDAGFAKTKAGKWLKKNAADYGFILRYPEDKVDVTDIEFEPWHYRYVGVDAARYIMDNGLCLEEYDEIIGLAN